MKLFIFQTKSPKFTAGLLIRASDEARVIAVAKEYAEGQHGLPSDDFPADVHIEEVSTEGHEAVLLASL